MLCKTLPHPAHPERREQPRHQRFRYETEADEYEREPARDKEALYGNESEAGDRENDPADPDRTESVEHGWAGRGGAINPALAVAGGFNRGPAQA